MLVSVLCSGSKGNCTYISTDKTKVLIDAGKNLKYIEEKLNELSTSIKEINYIIISHTHQDHVSALKSIIKKSNPIIILTEPMHRDLEYIHQYQNIKYLQDEMILGDIKLENIKTSHDASDSRGFILTNSFDSVVQITDTGYINQKHFNKITNKNVYIMESNHNLEMLMHGRYPKWLKQRVSSDVGHLSNDQSAFYLSKIIGQDTKKIILAHLSEENNTKEIALSTIKDSFESSEINFDNIEVAMQEIKTEPYTI